MPEAQDIVAVVAVAVKVMIFEPLPSPEEALVNVCVVPEVRITDLAPPAPIVHPDQVLLPEIVVVPADPSLEIDKAPYALPPIASVFADAETSVEDIVDELIPVVVKFVDVAALKIVPVPLIVQVPVAAIALVFEFEDE